MISLGNLANFHIGESPNFDDSACSTLTALSNAQSWPKLNNFVVNLN